MPSDVLGRLRPAPEDCYRGGILCTGLGERERQEQRIVPGGEVQTVRPLSTTGRLPQFGTDVHHLLGLNRTGAVWLRPGQSAFRNI